MSRYGSIGSTIVVLAVGIFSLSANAQVDRVASVVHYRHQIESKILGETRTILVRVPGGYETSKERFPLIVMLDAHPPQNAVVASLIEAQAFAGAMPEMILVGIQNTDRTRDMTPTRTDRAGSGGGDKFLEFIEDEVLPFVEKNYRTQPYRVFAGHSLGGLTAVYAMVSRPGLFDAYIAASPVLGWDKNYVVNKASELFRNKPKMDTTIFLALGNEPEYADGFNAFRDLLKRSAPDGLEYEFQKWDDEDHGTIIPRAYLFGLKRIFRGWAVPTNVPSTAVLRAHYAGLSKRFRYTIDPPEAVVNQLGYALLRAGRTEEAIEAFQLNVANFPDSANVYDSLAEANEKNGSKKKAIELYEKAYKMAGKKWQRSTGTFVKGELRPAKIKLTRR